MQLIEPEWHTFASINLIIMRTNICKLLIGSREQISVQFDHSSTIFMHENECQNIVWHMTTILLHAEWLRHILLIRV